MTDHPLGGHRAWLVWAAAAAVYVLAIFHRTSLGVAGILAAERFGISASQLATFTMVQLLVYAALQIPVGVLLDQLGPRHMLLIGLGVMTAAQLGFAVVASYPMGLVARVFVGMGDAMVFISVLRLVAAWFPPARSPIVTQLTGILGQLGAIGAAVPLAASLHSFGWTPSFAAAGSVGVVLGVALLLVVRDTPYEDKSRVNTVSFEAIAANLRMCWREPGTRLGLWTHFTSQFGVNVMVLLWGYPFLVQGQGLPPRTASALLAVLIGSAMAAGPVVGKLVARYPFSRSSLVLGIVATIVTTWTAVLMWPGPAPVWLLVLMLITVGVGGPSSMVGFDFARTFNPPGRLGSATGIVNVGGFVAALSTIVAIGIVLDLLTPGASTAYSPGAFKLAMAVQYVGWTVGALQIYRYRRRTRRTLYRRDPQAYAALRRGDPLPARS